MRRPAFSLDLLRQSCSVASASYVVQNLAFECYMCEQFNVLHGFLMENHVS